MTAAAQPREVNGSRTAVTTWIATNATERSARLRWRPTVRNRGQPGDCARATDRRPRHATALNRISETTPEPRVANHRIWVGIRGDSVGRSGKVSEKSIEGWTRPPFDAITRQPVLADRAPA